ncbi:hypothetical protein [Sinomonas atrocyanea]
MSTPTTQATRADAFQPSAELEGAIAREYRRERRLRTRDLLLSILTPIVLMACWEAAARGGLLDARLFTPRPRSWSAGRR